MYSSGHPRVGLVLRSAAFLHPKPSELRFAIRYLQVESNLVNAVPGSRSEAEGGGRCYFKILSRPLLHGCPRTLPAEGPRSLGGQEAARCGRLRKAAAGLCYWIKLSHN